MESFAIDYTLPNNSLERTHATARFHAQLPRCSPLNSGINRNLSQ
jgi:hypothetical protein